MTRGIFFCHLSWGKGHVVTFLILVPSFKCIQQEHNTDIPLKQLTLEDPTWSTNEKFYAIIVPLINTNPQAEEKQSRGVTYTGGLHIKTNDDEFEYRINAAQIQNLSHGIDFMTAPLPDTSSSYTAVTVSVDRIVRTATGTIRRPSNTKGNKLVQDVHFFELGVDVVLFTQAKRRSRTTFRVGKLSRNQTVRWDSILYS